MSKIIFIKYLPPQYIKRTQNLLKFGTFNISNMPIWMLVSKMVFMKYLAGQIKVKVALKFMFDISSNPILTMRSDKSFTEHRNRRPILNSNLDYKM